MTNDWLVPVVYGLLGALVLSIVLVLLRWTHRPPTAPAPPRTPELTARLPERQRPTAERAWLWDTLTPREMQVSRLAAAGMRNAEIARELNLSTYTVENHLKRVYSKLQLRSRVELAAFVREIDG